MAVFIDRHFFNFGKVEMGHLSNTFFFPSGFMPHGNSYLWNPALIWSMGISDLLICLSYFSISICLCLLVKKVKTPTTGMIWTFGLFFTACGATHFMEVLTLWHPVYWLAAGIKVFTAIVSVVGVGYLLDLYPKITELSQVIKIVSRHRIGISEAYREVIISNREFKNLLKTSLIYPITFLLILSAVFIAQIYFLLNATSWLDHTDQVISKVSSVYRQAVESQADFRGFMITKHPQMMMKSRTAGEEVLAKIPELKDLVSEDDEQVKNLTRTDVNFRKWLGSIEAYNSSSPGAALGIIYYGAPLFEKVKSSFHDIIDNEEALRRIRQKKVRETTVILIFLSIGLTLLVGAMIAFFSRSQLLKLSNNYDRALTGLEDKNASLLQEVDARKKSEVVRIQLVEDLKKALKSRDEFLSVASHELRTPIMSLQLQTRLLQGYMKKSKLLELTPKINKAAETCERQSERLAKLIELLLDITRIRLGKIELSLNTVELVSLTKEIIPQVVNSKPSEYLSSIAVVGDAQVFGVWDRLRMEQILINLISNAFKYGEGKPISIEIHADNIGEKAIFRIQDQGIGVVQGLQEKIFERFERAVSGEHISGLGLGLYIVTQLVRAHGGKISLISEQGKGAIFTMEIPFHIPARPDTSAYDTKESLNI